VLKGFEWLIAWRHLRDADRSTHKTLIVADVLLWLGALGLLLVALWPRFGKVHAVALAPGEWREARTAMWIVYVGIGAKISIGLSLIVFLLAFLLEMFTIFTAISIMGVFLGTAAPIIFLSVMSGFENDLKTKIRSTKADVVIEMREDRPFTDWQAVEAKLAGVRDVVGVMAYIETEVIMKHASNAAGMGIILRGVDPVRAPYVLGIQRMLKGGSVAYLEHPEQIPDDLFPELERDKGRRVLPGVLLGEELYQHILRVFVGSEVDIACPMCGIGPTGPIPKLKPFRVAGHFYTGMYEFDAKLAYISLHDAQKFLGMQDEVTGIEIKTTTPEAAAAVAHEITGRLGPAYEVRTWEELNRALYGALKIEKLAAFIALCFILLVASFSIAANLLMMVTEKAREIAILKSMGARDGAVVRIFVAEGLYIGVVGLLIGVVYGVAACLGLAKYGLPLPVEVYYIEQMPVVMRAGEIASIGLAALALSCLATIYPALLASRIRPADGLRFD